MRLASAPLKGRNFEHGRILFHSPACFSCHRFNGSGGGLGPDLTAWSVVDVPAAGTLEVELELKPAGR